MVQLPSVFISANSDGSVWSLSLNCHIVISETTFIAIVEPILIVPAVIHRLQAPLHDFIANVGRAWLGRNSSNWRTEICLRNQQRPDRFLFQSRAIHNITFDENNEFCQRDPFISLCIVNFLLEPNNGRKKSPGILLHHVPNSCAEAHPGLCINDIIAVSDYWQAKSGGRLWELPEHVNYLRDEFWAHFLAHLYSSGAGFQGPSKLKKSSDELGYKQTCHKRSNCCVHEHKDNEDQGLPPLLTQYPNSMSEPMSTFSSSVRILMRSCFMVGESAPASWETAGKENRPSWLPSAAGTIHNPTALGKSGEPQSHKY